MGSTGEALVWCLACASKNETRSGVVRELSVRMHLNPPNYA